MKRGYTSCNKCNGNRGVERSDPANYSLLKTLGREGRLKQMGLNEEEYRLFTIANERRDREKNTEIILEQRNAIYIDGGRYQDIVDMRHQLMVE